MGAMTAPGHRAPDDHGSPLGRPGPAPLHGPPGYDLPADRRRAWERSGGHSSGFRMLPFPGWSTRTRRGTQVTVGGCCLPLPIGCLTTTVLTAAAVVVATGARRCAG
ncbi:hypothetical protein AUQ48_00160 [Kocuria flava]|uniref:Uncharacterized protein n=2 Tax=Kocuria flava TaxID=446860 RepID=A0A2N4SYA8_9MICC|nr:hypothetical protein AUQ48_00160 [Kocuria flava]